MGIVKGDKILSNAKDIYTPEKKGWGIEPNKAAHHHEEVKYEILDKSLEDAGLELKDIDLIAFSQGPGLPPCLYKGFDFVKELVSDKDIPVLGIAHTVSHIEIGKLETGSEDPITLYVSGGNTQVLGFSNGSYRVFGEVMDTPIGNGLDKFGRSVGIKFPAGPKIEEMAKKGEKYIELPYSVKGMDMSFSGLVTEAERKYRNGEKLEDVCYSLQETAFAMLTEVVERAMAHTGKEEVLLTGGVAANKRLQEMLNEMCEERGAKFYTVP
ncbi:MAG: tRNA (adenosine(37)-N6)-threonylcarbamoyltransferase complex transferase subunit TsaD, partial [Candidatus Aenigmatarchaeota archaeon]